MSMNGPTMEKNARQAAQKRVEAGRPKSVFAFVALRHRAIWIRLYVMLFIIILKGFDPIFLLSCFYYISITYSLVLRNCFISFNFVCTVYFFLFFLNFPRHKSTYFCNKNKYGKADHFVSPEL